MKPELLARLNAATSLVQKRDLNGATDVIRAALMRQDDISYGPRQSQALSEIDFQPRRQVDLAALPSSKAPLNQISEPSKLPARSVFSRRVRRPLPDILASLKRMPLASSQAGGLASRKPSGVAFDPLPSGAMFETHSFASATGQRNYKLYVPSHTFDAPRPLVVMLHGCTQDADDFAIGTKMNRLAEELNILIAYPEQSSSANNLRCWSWFNPRDQKRDNGEPAIIAGITLAVASKYNVDPARIFIAGLSAGGAMAVVMGKTYPDIFSAVGVHSGLPFQAASDVPSAFAAMRNGQPRPAQFATARDTPPPSGNIPRTIVFHGEADTTVHPENGERLFIEAARGEAITIQVDSDHAATSSAFRRRIAMTRAGDIIAEYWTILEGGHAWSGGDARGSYATEQGPDATREMVRFFLETSAPSTDHGN